MLWGVLRDCLGESQSPVQPAGAFRQYFGLAQAITSVCCVLRRRDHGTYNSRPGCELRGNWSEKLRRSQTVNSISPFPISFLTLARRVIRRPSRFTATVIGPLDFRTPSVCTQRKSQLFCYHTSCSS